MGELERCFICDCPTGRAGQGEDSIYYSDGDLGPFCPDCQHQLEEEVIDNIDLLQRRHDALREAASVLLNVLDDHATGSYGEAEDRLRAALDDQPKPEEKA